MIIKGKKIGELKFQYLKYIFQKKKRNVKHVEKYCPNLLMFLFDLNRYTPTYILLKETKRDKT